MNKNWIRLLTLIITSVMVLSLFACGGESESTSVEESKTETTVEDTTPAEKESSEATEKQTGTPDTDAKETEKAPTEATTAEDSEATTESESTADSSESESSSASESESSSEASEVVTTVGNDSPEVKETDEGETTEEIVETTEEKEEVTVLEYIYGYDFEDSSWSELYDKAGSATRSIVNDPAGSGKLVLAVVHSESQTASYIKNKNKFENTASGKVTVGVDLYIPSDALDESGDAVQMQINDEYNHHCNLVSDTKGSLSAFDTKDFPRDKWFTVRFVFDMDTLRYNVEVVEDGQVRTTIFAGRSASNLAGVGPLVLRVHVSGNDQTVYLDHMGVVTTRVVVNGGDQTPEDEVASDVKFLRIEGINAAGEKLSVYGDFTGKATVADLTELTWEKSDSYKGTYTSVSGATSPEYTPEGGGYYLRVKAKFGVKTLTSYPVYIQESANNSFYHAYHTFFNRL